MKRQPVRKYPVRITAIGDDLGKLGHVIAETKWGNNRVRWYWVKFEDGKLKAFPLGAFQRVRP